MITCTCTYIPVDEKRFIWPLCTRTLLNLEYRWNKNCFSWLSNLVSFLYKMSKHTVFKGNHFINCYFLNNDFSKSQTLPIEKSFLMWTVQHVCCIWNCTHASCTYMQDGYTLEQITQCVLDSKSWMICASTFLHNYVQYTSAHISACVPFTCSMLKFVSNMKSPLFMSTVSSITSSVICLCTYLETWNAAHVPESRTILESVKQEGKSLSYKCYNHYESFNYDNSIYHVQLNNKN